MSLNCPLSVSESASSWNCKGGIIVHLQGRKELALSSLGAKPSRRRFHNHTRRACGDFHVGAFLYDPTRDPILKDALKEPVAFMGGIFAGLLRLDLNEDPLREWVARTAEAAGITEEEVGTGNKESEEFPQQIEIE